MMMDKHDLYIILSGLIFGNSIYIAFTYTPIALISAVCSLIFFYKESYIFRKEVKNKCTKK